MNRTFYPFKYAVSWTVCAVALGLFPLSFGQSILPPLMPVTVPNFTIPFEIEESANSIREIELFVSKDRGRRWTSVARKPVESKKFTFRADTDGEYWFALRTAGPGGNMAPISGPPELRVLVNTSNEPMVILPSQPSESGPLTPPKPERFRGENVAKPQPKPAPAQPANTDEPEIDEVRETMPEQENAEEPTRILAPQLPGFESLEMGKKSERNLLDDLLSGMRPFMDVHPVEVSRVLPNNQDVFAVPNILHPSMSKPSADLLAGSIARVDLNNTGARPQIVLKWNTGQELWNDAQVDVFRSGTREGPWSPIAINLSNSGEYWWFLTPEDMKPFYVAVRIRSYNGGIQMDITHSAIMIDQKLSAQQGAWRSEPGERK